MTIKAMGQMHREGTNQEGRLRETAEIVRLGKHFLLGPSGNARLFQRVVLRKKLAETRTLHTLQLYR
jgi:hypothetical protein